MSEITQKVHVIRLLPTGNSPAARAERAHLQASRWAVRSAPGGEAVAGRAYLVEIDVAANLLRKGWVLCDANGKPNDAELPESKPTIRAGTEEWLALPPDQRPGTEEYREAELNRLLHEAYLKEQTELAVAHEQGKHQGAPIDDCPTCTNEKAAAELAAVAPKDGQQQDGGSGDGGGQSGSTADDPQTPPGGEQAAEGTQTTDTPPDAAAGAQDGKAAAPARNRR